MTSSEKTNWFVPLFVIAISVGLLGLLYFQSQDVSSQQEPQDRKEFDYAGRPVQPITVPNQLMLMKNQRQVIDRNGLVFKGLDRNEILIDLYLLDMDPEQPYRKRFSQKEAKKELLLGKRTYRLVGVKDNSLTLRIVTEP